MIFLTSYCKYEKMKLYLYCTDPLQFVKLHFHKINHTSQIKVLYSVTVQTIYEHKHLNSVQSIYVVALFWITFTDSRLQPVVHYTFSHYQKSQNLHTDVMIIALALQLFGSRVLCNSNVSPLTVQYALSLFLYKQLVNRRKLHTVYKTKTNPQYI